MTRMDLSGEVWRPIPGWESDYAVSNLGRVCSLPPRARTKDGTSRVLKLPLSRKGYPTVSLSRQTRTVHQLVLAAFVGPRPPHMEEIRHLDGNKLNNRVENLRYGTRSENAQDKIRHGNNANLNKTTCTQGHPYDDENTYRVPTTGQRMCRTCTRHRQADPAKRPVPPQNARKTHCLQGHPFDETNTYTWNGRRTCRACNRAAVARRAQRRRQECAT